MARKSKEVLNKEQETKAKVDKLLDGINIKTNDKKKVGDRIAKLEEASKDGWLEDQFDALSDENEKLKTQLAHAMSEAKQAKDDYKKLFEQKAGSVAAPAQVKQGSGLTIQQKNELKMFLVEMENQVRGRNAARRPNDQVQIRYVINKIVQIFPDLI